MSAFAIPVEARERRRFTVAEYHRMGVAGILADNERVELVAGELLTMAPIGPRHATCVNLLVQLLSRSVGGKVVVSPQNALVLSENSELYPDIALLRGRPERYADAHPRPDDVLLVIEVADTSLHHDREVKAPLYATAGIVELWIVDLTGGSVEVLREPNHGRYGFTRHFSAGGALTPLALPRTRFAVADVLPSTKQGG
ncbi:MAG: Uma2 family endonuclease [Nitrococcus sp.]|nr:Uma2 family endonuclease [Nitrococcus sp.]